MVHNFVYIYVCIKGKVAARAVWPDDDMVTTHRLMTMHTHMNSHT